MARIYLETSFVSACVTTRTDVASLYRRQNSLEWWQYQAQKHELAVSAEVLAELSAPAYRRREAALAFVAGIASLAIDSNVAGLATILVRERVMPGPVAGDALHVAIATVHRVDYILSWNVRHLANANKLTHLRTICLRVGYVPPQIVTPELLWSE